MSTVAVNCEEDFAAFIRINEAWIEQYFALESIDLALAANTKGILLNGGFIFSLREAGKVVGVCALFNAGDGVYELARMAVTPECQRRGYGRQLLEAALEHARHMQADRVRLLSNAKLEAALALYRRYGFEAVTRGSYLENGRCNIFMELELNAEQGA